MDFEEEKKKMHAKYMKIINDPYITTEEMNTIVRMHSRLDDDHIYDPSYLVNFTRNVGKYAKFQFNDNVCLIIGVVSEPNDFFWITLVEDKDTKEVVVRYESAVERYDIINDDLMMFTHRNINNAIKKIYNDYKYINDSRYFVLNMMNRVM